MSDDRRLDDAAAALRAHARDRWVEVSDRVVAAALSAPRRSRPIRAQAAGGSLQVSDRVVVALLREAIDGAVPGTAVHRISLTVVDRDVLEAVIVQIVVRYGLPILPAADRIRDITHRVLTDVLGPDTAGVAVRVTHVHVGDVTVGDPATSDPDT